MILTDIVGIIADDLTGANDTALQFHKQGADTKILLDCENVKETKDKAEVWAISSESRNVTAEFAILRVENVLSSLLEHFSFDYYYKKIDSTLRGHIALETLTMLNMLEYDAAIIIPAFPQEGRITVGGYHMVNGIPLGKTEIAIDPHSPITESHVPTLLRSQLGEQSADIVGLVDLRTVMNGAGPILVRINELVKEGKKLIVADAASVTDIEQLALAINKSDKKLLPAGTASLAQVLSKYWLAGIEKEENGGVEVGRLPRFIVSGTATQITANQISKLEQTADSDKINFIALDTLQILNGVDDFLVGRVVKSLNDGVTVCVHTSNLVADFDGFSEDFLNAELTREKFAGVITDYLAELTGKVLAEVDALLITLGGETSYKCCAQINSCELRLVDEVSSAISLCYDTNGRWIITKSGNLGNTDTLIDILNYLNRHE